MSTSYAPGTAVHEYQEALAAQRTADAAAALSVPQGQLGGYVLADRLPDWHRLLDIARPWVWSTDSLRTACARLRDPDSLPGASPARIAEQLLRFETALDARRR